MPLNPNIAMGFQAPQIDSPFNAMARMAQLDAANQESQLNALRMQDLQRQRAQEERFSNALRDDYNSPEGEKALFAASPTRAIEFFKGQAERKKLAAEAGRVKAETADRILATYRAMLPEIQTPEQMVEWYMHQRGRSELADTPVFAHSLEQKIAAIPRDPAKFAEFKAQVEMGMDKYLTYKATSERGIPLTAGGTLADPRLYGFTAPPPASATTPKPAGVETQVIRGAPGVPDKVVQITPGINNSPPQVSSTDIPGTAKPTLAETLDVKDIADRNKKYVGAKAAVESFETKAAQHIKDLKDLANHPGLGSITGLLYGRTPSLTGRGRAAEVLFKKVDSSELLETITEIKRQSPTGASPLGQFTDSDRETVRSTSGFSRTLDAADLKQELLKAADKLENVRNRARKTFNETYEYKNSAPTTSTTTPADAPAAAPDKVGSVSNPNVIKDQADFNALPSGAYFRGPDNVIRRKP